MTVINPSSISGITSITMPSGDGNVLTIHTNDGTERFRIDSSGNVKVGSACTISQDGDVFFTGVTTATTYAGSGANLTNLPAANVTGTLPAISGANLTNLPAANLTGALPAISGANLTGIAATDNVRTGILDVAGIATFRSDVNLPNINGSQIGGRRNLIINGAMNIAQRSTSDTQNGYYVMDRFQSQVAGADESPVFSQVDVASGTPAYQAGFRKAFKILNGNQTSGAGAADRAEMAYKLEAQDLAKSGWNYTSSSSFITLSFWIKSSVAQSFYVRLLTADGTGQRYAFETGSLSADTWTKVTKTIPGNSNLQFDNNVNEGLKISWYAFLGTDYTDSSSLNTWAAGVSGNRTPDQTSTWWTTNDSTLELTGVQLEVGSQATPFEHEDNNTTLRRCQRYFWKFGLVANAWIYSGIIAGSQDGARCLAKFPVPMRANPTITYNNLYCDSEVSGSVETINGVNDTHFNSDFGGRINFSLASASTQSVGGPLNIYPSDANGYLQGDSEL
jgi:hypothetical protein